MVLKLNFDKKGKLTFFSNNQAIKIIDIEIADKNQDVERGLMDRKNIPNDFGMLFILKDLQPVAFWMKNTYVPLDIIFIDSDYKIIDIHQNNQPLSTKPIIPNGQAKFTIEVKAGFCYQYKIKKGDYISYTNK